MIYYHIIKTGQSTKYEYLSLNLNKLKESIIPYKYKIGLIRKTSLESYFKEDSPRFPDTWYRRLK